MKTINYYALLALLLMMGGLTMQAQNRELPTEYWTDIVTEQPEGYVVDGNGDVHIYTAEALAWLSVVSNGFNGQEIDVFEGRTVSIEANVDMSSALWIPICGVVGHPAFRGSFDGKEHVIDHIQMVWVSGYYFGFFGMLFEATLSNVVMRNGYFEGGYDAGFLAFKAIKTHIDHCFVECEIHRGVQECVPFVHFNIGSTISNSLAYCPLLQSEDWSGNGVGGAFVAESLLYNGDTTLPQIINCASIVGQMTWTEQCGFVGNINHGLIENCYVYIEEMLNFTGYAPGPGPRNGITRDNGGEIYNCYFNRIRNHDYPTYTNYYIYLDDSPGEGGIIQNTKPYVEEGRGQWKLIEEISFELNNGTVSTDDLLDALNFKIQELDDETLLNWCDTGMDIDNQFLPVLCDFDVTEAGENPVPDNHVEVFPNPASEVVCVEGVEADEVQVFNALGQRVKTVCDTNEIPVADLPQGIYLLRIAAAEGRVFITKVLVR